MVDLIVSRCASAVRGADPWKVDADNGSTGSEPSEMALKWTGHTVCLACDLSFGMVPIPYRDPVLRS